MKKLWYIAIAVCLLLIASGCDGSAMEESPSPEESETVPMVEVTPEVAEDGYIYVILPENLLGGKSAEEALNTEGKETILNIYSYATDCYANEDGTATYVFTPDQFEECRSNIFEFGQLSDYSDDTPINRVVYEDEMLTKITVYVDIQEYMKGGYYYRGLANLSVALCAGTYQVLGGTNYDEWHTAITVIDEETGEVFTEKEYPLENMYSMSSVY